MIQNRERLTETPAHALALDCIEAAIDAAQPETATRSNVSLDGETLSVADATYDLGDYEEVLVFGGGKAAHGVVTALESILGDAITDGLVVTKHPTDTDVVRTVTGDHPLPSKRNVRATDELLDLATTAGSETLVLFVVTGGASALLTAPAGDPDVDDMRETTEVLLEGGVPIQEINAVRKHLSNTKGGQFARSTAPATVAALILSDVVGNGLSAIGSGPTVPDETTFDEALDVFERYDLAPPDAVADHLAAGSAGDIPETPFADDPAFDGVDSQLIGDNALSLAAARRVARDAGYAAVVLSSRLRGEASEVTKAVVSAGEEMVTTGNPVEPPAVLLAGGECTVTLAGEPGQGGPNQEFILSGALELTERAVVAAVDTDGEDGSSDVAGAIAGPETVTDPDRARTSLAENDAGTYLSSVDATIRTAPTGTNVNDIVVMVVPKRTE